MHFPYYLSFGTHKILLHAITEVLAFFIGYRYYLQLKKTSGDTIAGNNRLLIIVGAALGALLGSRILGGLEDPAAMMRASNRFVYFYTNKTVVGGFLGGWLGVEGMKKIIGEKRPSGDLFTLPIIIALIIGRIGCFSMGVYEETYGLPTTLFTGMDLGDGIPRHPVTLYEIVFLFLLFAAISFISKKYTLAPGAKFKIFMAGYLTFRFLLDFIKPHYTWPLELSTIQIACLLGLLYYFRYIIQPKKLLAAYAGAPLHVL